MSERHKWGDADRPTNKLSIRNCVRCKMRKLSHHDTDPQTGLPYHWTEFTTSDGRQIGCVGTPPCDGKPAEPPPLPFIALV